VGYRNDTDAAFARADALEVDLRRSERECDQLRAEVDRLSRAVPEAPARVVAAGLSKPELDALIAELEGSAVGPPSAARGCVMLALALPLFWWPHGALLGLVLAVLGSLAVVGSLMATPGIARSVIDAVRDAPDQVVAVQESARARSSWGKRVVFVRTTWGSARFRTSSPDAVLVALARRCPHARLR
jgi:hypothetical protein